MSRNTKTIAFSDIEREGLSFVGQTFVVPADSSNTWVVLNPAHRENESMGEMTLESLETIPEEDENDPNLGDGSRSIEGGGGNRRRSVDQSGDKSMPDCRQSFDKGKYTRTNHAGLDELDRNINLTSETCTHFIAPDLDDGHLSDERIGFPWPLDRPVSFNLLLEKTHRNDEEEQAREKSSNSGESECESRTRKIIIQVLTPRNGDDDAFRKNPLLFCKQ